LSSGEESDIAFLLKGEHKSDEEAQKQRAVVRQESGALESESHDMMNRDISPHLSQIEQGLHNHINESHNQLQEQLPHMYELQSQMQERLDFFIERQNHNKQFNCNASFGGSFVIEVEDKQNEHNNSRNGSKVDNATKEILKRSCGPPLPSNSNVTELKPPAKSPSTPRRSKDQDKTSHKPRKGNIHDKKRPKLDIIRNSQSKYMGNLLLLKQLNT
jgi:hypothetical protein